MVVIRFKREGTKKTPHHRIVVTEQARSQAGAVLEVVGYYDPSATPEKFSVNQARVQHWVASGARVSESLRRLLKRHAK